MCTFDHVEVKKVASILCLASDDLLVGFACTCGQVPASVEYALTSSLRCFYQLTAPCSRTQELHLFESAYDQLVDFLTL